jgi:hypothetical protein
LSVTLVGRHAFEVSPLRAQHAGARHQGMSAPPRIPCRTQEVDHAGARSDAAGQRAYRLSNACSRKRTASGSTRSERSKVSPCVRSGNTVNLASAIRVAEFLACVRSLSAPPAYMKQGMLTAPSMCSREGRSCAAAASARRSFLNRRFLASPSNADTPVRAAR